MREFLKVRLITLLILVLMCGVAGQGLLRTEGGETSLTPGDKRAYAANGTGPGVIEREDGVTQPWPLRCLDNYYVRIEVIPKVPIEGEPITLRISGTSGDSCTPEYLMYETQGHWIDVSAEELSCVFEICLDIVVPWTFDVHLDSVPAGSYMAGFRLLCEPMPPFVPPPSACSAAPFTVIPCCDFDGDGQVDGDDVRDIAARWHQAAGVPYDSDGDEQVTLQDISRVTTRWGDACP